MNVDYSPEAIEDRLRDVARAADLRVAHRLDAKVDYSPAAITRRLQRVAELRRLCLLLGAAEGPP